MDEPDEERALRGAASVEPLGAGRFALNLSPMYTVVGHPHGGYLQCVMGSGALAAASDEGATHLHVTSMTTNYINAIDVGAAELRVEIRRVGRGVSFAYAAIVQNDVLAAESLVTMGTLGEDSSLRYQDAVAPTMATLEECRQSTGSDEINIMRVVDLRLDPSCTGWWTGDFSSKGEVRGWLRLNDGEASWSPWSLLFAGDALPPSTLPLGSSGWVPTLQLTSHVHRVPTSEWLRARQWAVVIADGMLDQRCELFDESGQLVASSSQLAMVRLPSAR